MKDEMLDCSEEDRKFVGLGNDVVGSIKPHGVEWIQNEREDDYGDAKGSHTSIANFWNEYLERKMSRGVFDGLDATDVAVMLSLMKVSRLAYKRKEDSFVDFASYADFALQFETNDKPH